MSCDVSLHVNAVISALAVQLQGEPKASGNSVVRRAEIYKHSRTCTRCEQWHPSTSRQLIQMYG